MDATRQKIKAEVVILKKVLGEIDRFIENLTERLENPNKTLLGKPSAVKADDVKFKDCPKAIQSLIGNVLKYRPLFGNAPPQYAKLQGILEQTIPNTSPKDKYTDPKVEFFHRMRNLMLILQDPKSADKVPACKPYVRVVNLLMNTTTDGKDKFKYDGLYTELSNFIKKVDSKAEEAEIKEIVSAITDEYAIDLKYGMPQVPSGAPIEEPAPNVTESDITSELSAPTAAVGSTTTVKAPLTNPDKMKIAGIAAQLTKNPKIQERGLSVDQIRKIAENIYRKKTGKGRKTYRKKKSQRKTRKMRRV